MRSDWQALLTIGKSFLDMIIANYIIYVFFQNANRGRLLEPWLLQKDKYGTIDSAIWACAAKPGELEGYPLNLTFPPEAGSVDQCPIPEKGERILEGHPPMPPDLLRRLDVRS
jgi:hypothetical protein